VSAPFVVDQTLSGLTFGQGRLFNMAIYNVTATGPDSLIYSTQGDIVDVAEDTAYTVTKTISLYGQMWKIKWTPRTLFFQRMQSESPLIILMGGILFSVLLGAFLVSFSIRDEETIHWLAEEKKLSVSLSIFLVVAFVSYYMYSTLNIRETEYLQTRVKQESTKIEKQTISWQRYRNFPCLCLFSWWSRLFPITCTAR